MTMMTTTAMMIIIVKALYAFSVKSTEMAVHLVKPGMLKITADCGWHELHSFANTSVVF